MTSDQTLRGLLIEQIWKRMGNVGGNYAYGLADDLLPIIRQHAAMVARHTPDVSRGLISIRQLIAKALENMQ